MESRSYAGPYDLQRILDFLMACRSAEPEGEHEPVGDLLWAFRRQFEPERNIRLWEEAEGLVGFAMVDPEWGMILDQGRSDAPRWLRRELVAWGTERLKQAVGECGGDIEAWVQARENSVAKIAFLEAEGFTRGDSSYVELLRPLDRPVPQPHVPEGFSIRGLAGEWEVPAYVDMHRDAWSVWAPSTYSAEHHLRLMRNPGYNIDLNPVVVAPDSTLVSGCIGWLDPINKIGEIEPLGTRPAYARMGLARAVSIEVLRRMQEHGMETALVYGTHVNEPAWDLYQSLGFKRGRTIHNYHRRL